MAAITSPKMACRMNPLEAEDESAVIAWVARLAAGASRRMMLYVPEPDMPIWSAPTLLEPLRSFMVEDSRREVRWLFDDTDDLPRIQPGLVSLAQRLPSLCLLRQSDPTCPAPAPHAFVAGDHGVVLLFERDERSAATACYEVDRIRPMMARFHDAWDRARPLTELRALGL